ncbi:hypothetical protein ACSBR2_036691 [Camellia fascicularis]
MADTTQMPTDPFTIELEKGTNESVDNSNLYLIGKILVPKLINKQTVSRIILGAWKTRVEVTISSWADNIYLFPFQNEDDRALVLKTAPWSIMGNLLVHGLPMDKMTRCNGQIIGESTGKLIGVEAPNDGLLLSRSFLRLRVEVNVTLPLPRGFKLQRQIKGSTEMKEIWVSFKYERLFDFCYDCERIGHDKNSCKFVSREAGRLSSYGLEMRIGVTKNIGLPVEFYRHQIDELEARLRSLLRHNSNAPLESRDGLRAELEISQTNTTANGA